MRARQVVVVQPQGQGQIRGQLRLHRHHQQDPWCAALSSRRLHTVVSGIMSKEINSIGHENLEEHHLATQAPPKLRKAIITYTLNVPEGARMVTQQFWKATRLPLGLVRTWSLIITCLDQLWVLLMFLWMGSLCGKCQATKVINGSLPQST